MKVLIDAHMVGSNETGNEMYVVNLLAGLAETASCQLAAAVDPNLSLPNLLSDASIEKLHLLPAGNWLRLLHTLPKLCRQWQANILHTTYVAPFFLPCSLVVSVHDISFKRYPKFFSPRERLLFATLLSLTLRRAKAVLTISNHAKAEIVQVFPQLSGKVHAVFLAASPIFRPINDSQLLESIQSRYGIKSKFILAVGNLQPRKNLLRLVRAFSSIRDDFNEYQLVIVGKARWQSSKVFTAVKRLGLEHEVVFTGYVPDEDLMLLYNAAKVFVYPSVYEGFGLPILEAMACGTPVITSNTSSMPEVAGDAALLVDPYQEEQIACTVSKVLRNRDLTLSLSEKGLRQAKQFSWHRTARETLAVYQNVLDQHRQGQALL